MKRLTFHESGRWGISEMNQMNEGQKMYAVSAKLRDYEDTGLSPCEVEDMMIKQDWVKPTYGLPDDPEIGVLVTVSGKLSTNISLDNAVLIANYNKQEGWILESWPEYEEIEVKAWMPLPEAYSSH